MKINFIWFMVVGCWWIKKLLKSMGLLMIVGLCMLLMGGCMWGRWQGQRLRGGLVKWRGGISQKM